MSKGIESFVTMHHAGLRIDAQIVFVGARVDHQRVQGAVAGLKPARHAGGSNVVESGRES